MYNTPWNGALGKHRKIDWTGILVLIGIVYTARRMSKINHSYFFFGWVGWMLLSSACIHQYGHFTSNRHPNKNFIYWFLVISRSYIHMNTDIYDRRYSLSSSIHLYEYKQTHARNIRYVSKPSLSAPCIHRAVVEYVTKSTNFHSFFHPSCAPHQPVFFVTPTIHTYICRPSIRILDACSTTTAAHRTLAHNDTFVDRDRQTQNNKTWHPEIEPRIANIQTYDTRSVHGNIFFSFCSFSPSISYPLFRAQVLWILLPACVKHIHTHTQIQTACKAYTAYTLTSQTRRQNA